MTALAVYGKLVGARIRSQLQYRASFALEVAAMFLIAFLEFVAIVILFETVPALGGWTLPQIAFLYGVTNLVFALADMVVGHLDAFPNLIREGTFDAILIRPVSTLLQVLSSDFALRRLGQLSQALIVFGYALVAAEIEWTAVRALVLATMLVCGMVIFCAIWVAGASLIFWLVDGMEVTSAFTYGGRTMLEYPFNIYESWLRRFMGFVIPLAFVNYFPSLYVLDKPDPLGFPAGLQFASPLVAAVSALVAVRVWGLAVRHYRSAGG